MSNFSHKRVTFIFEQSLNENKFSVEGDELIRKCYSLNEIEDKEMNKAYNTLNKLIKEYVNTDKIVFYMIREEDDKVVGIFNLMKKNDRYYINYSVKNPVEHPGYLKMLLYLSLLKTNELNLNEVYVEGKTNSVIIDNSIKLVGGILEFEEEEIRTYKINVKKSIDKYKNFYDSFVK